MPLPPKAKDPYSGEAVLWEGVPYGTKTSFHRASFSQQNLARKNFPTTFVKMTAARHAKRTQITKEVNNEVA